jgi:hypothetical protein
MKIRDIVFVVDADERKITKTKVIGIQDLLEKKEYGSEDEVIKKYYKLKGEKEDRNSNDGWTSGEDLVATLEEAQKIIGDRIQKEIIDLMANITVVDYSGGK